MKGLRKAMPKGFVNNWIRPDQIKGCSKNISWFDLPERIKKKTKVAKSYPGLSPWITPTKRTMLTLTTKEERTVKAIRRILLKDLGVDINHDLTMYDRTRALVQSARWEATR